MTRHLRLLALAALLCLVAPLAHAVTIEKIVSP